VGKVSSVGGEEFPQSQKLLYFLNTGRKGSFLNSLVLISAREDAGLCEVEP